MAYFILKMYQPLHTASALLRRSLLVVLVVAAIQSKAGAQGIMVKAGFDSASILIGDQLNFNLTVEQPRNVNVVFPVYTDTLIGKVEIISASKIDTFYMPNGRIELSQRYLVTCFDSGVYVVNPVMFVAIAAGKADTLTTQPAPLTVNTLQIKDPKKIADIKSVIEMPLTFSEMVPYILSGFGVFLLIAIIMYIYLRIKHKKPIFGLAEKPKEPAHVKAYRELEKIKTEKLWQQSLYKQYHSRISDTLRTYIEERFQVPALESTSEEIFEIFKSNSFINSKLLLDLKELLALADLVKFAKAEPMPEENDKSWQQAYDFVTKTYRDEETTPNTDALNNETRL